MEEQEGSRLRKKIDIFRHLETSKAKTSIDTMLKSRTASQPNIETSQKRSLKKSKNKSSARLGTAKNPDIYRKEVDSILDKKLKQYNNTVSTACGDSKKNNTSTLTKNKKSSRSSKVIAFTQMKLLSPKGSYVPYLGLTRKKSLTRHLSPPYSKGDNSQQAILDILQRKNSLNCFKKLLKGKQQQESTMNSLRLSKGAGNSTRAAAFGRKSSSKKSINKQSWNERERISGHLSPDAGHRSSSELRPCATEDPLVNPRIIDAMNDVYDKLNNLLFSLKIPGRESKNQSCADSAEHSEKKIDSLRRCFGRK